MLRRRNRKPSTTTSETNAPPPNPPADVAFVIPDPHCPYHCEQSTQQLLEDIRTTRPRWVILLGDVLDAYSVSSFDKNPARRLLLNDEREVAVAWLAGIRAAAPHAQIDLCEGNHEDRVRRYLWSRAPALAALRELEVPNLLRCPDLDITYHSRNGFKRWGHRFKHGDTVRAKAGESGKIEMEAHRIGGFSGHTHRVGVATTTDREGVTTRWWETGHLCDVTKADYVAAPNWQKAYFKIHDPENEFAVEPILLD